MSVFVVILNLYLISENFRKGFDGIIVNMRNECFLSGFMGNESER